MYIVHQSNVLMFLIHCLNCRGFVCVKGYHTLDFDSLNSPCSNLFAMSLLSKVLTIHNRDIGG